jgi:uncharacterized protein (DUF58 family)
MIVEVGSFPNPAGLLPGGEALRRRTHQVTTNASGVREYMPGDSLNRIHWVSTARRDRLMVKEFELDPLAEVWIFLDADRFPQSSLPQPKIEFNILNYWRQKVKVNLPPSTEEYGVSIAASLARYFIRSGRSVGLVALGQIHALLPPDRGGRQLGKLLEALALLHAEGELPLRGLVEAQAKHVPRGSTVVLITPTTASFGGRTGTPLLAEKIRAMGVPVRVVSLGADLSAALSNGYRAHALDS